LRAVRTPLAALALALVALVAGCGGSGASGSTAEKTIKADWDFNPDFPGRPALKDSTVDRVACQAKPAHDRVRCTVSVRLKDGGRQQVGVVATFDGETLSRWDFATGPGV
jgi:predicted component of type VI protein secretion system